MKSGSRTQCRTVVVGFESVAIDDWRHGPLNAGEKMHRLTEEKMAESNKQPPSRQ